MLACDAATGHSRGDLLGGRIVTESLIAFSPDAKIIASGDVPDGGFTLWDRASGRELSHVDTGWTGSTTVAWDPHRPILVTTGAPGFVRFWDVTDLRHPVATPSPDRARGSPGSAPTGASLVVADAFSTKIGDRLRRRHRTASC